MPVNDYSSVGSSTGVNTNGITVETPYEKEDDLISVDSFLQLMIAEMTSTNPFSDEGGGGGSNTTDYITQLAQITTMQQMKQLAYYSKGNYAMSLVGKDVTAASMAIGGNTNKVTGTVEKVSFVDEDFVVYVDGKGYSLSQIMSVNESEYVDDEQGLDDIKTSQLVFLSRTDSSAKIRWDVPDVKDAIKEKLTYSVYYSDEDNVSTVSAAKEGKLAGKVKGSDIMEGAASELNITGLEAGTTYYANVVATTESGKEYIYKRVAFTTKEDS